MHVLICVELMEEVYLKEKLVRKRSLTLLRSLLKYYNLRERSRRDELYIIDEMCQGLTIPVLQATKDFENFYLALECIGLICILDKAIFIQYADELYQKITEKEGFEPREKEIAIKAAMDGLIVHAKPKERVEVFQRLFDLLTGAQLLDLTYGG